MNESEITKILSEIFYNIFGYNTFEKKSNMNNIAEWDSLKHIALVIEIEKRFNIQINHTDIIEMISVKKMIEIIKYYKKNND